MLLGLGIKNADIETTLSAAEDHCTSDQNDVVLVTPGAYVETAELDWDKDQTHIVGLGGPNQAYQPSTLTNGGVRISTVTSAVTNLLDVSGHYCQFHNIGTFNSYNGANNICDVKIAGKNFYAKGCSFRGGTGVTQVATDGAGVPLYFATGTAGAGNAARFDDCIIGSSGNTTRSKGPGCVVFQGGAAAGFGVFFNNCRFSTRIETASANNCCMVRLAGDYAVDRELYFKQCLFYNFVENLASKLDYCIDDECSTTHNTVLDACTLIGVDYWCNVATYTFTNTADAVGYGGKGIVITAS